MCCTSGTAAPWYLRRPPRTTHTARWLHVVRHIQAAALDIHARHADMADEIVVVVAYCRLLLFFVEATLSVTSCLHWTKAVRWATSCWTNKSEEEEEDAC